MIPDDVIAGFRSLLVDDHAGHHDYRLGLDPMVDQAWTELVNETFLLLTYRCFGESRRVSEIIRFVADMRARHPDDVDVDPAVAERELRAALGDAPAVSGLKAQERATVRAALLDVLFHDEQLADSDIDALIAEAQVRATRSLALRRGPTNG